MNDPTYTPDSGSSGLKTAILVGAVIALVAANVYLYLQVDTVKNDMAKLRESVASEVTNLREASTVTTATNRRTVDNLKNELDTARRQAAAAAGVAKTEALAQVEKVAARLAEEQRKQEQQLTTQIGEVKDAASSANTKIADVSGEVNTVKGQVSSTKAELEKTIADLKRVTGDLGEHSSLIATNGKELAALRRLGERNYVEFNLAKSKAPQRIGDITMLLKKTDQKRNKYTVEVFADDKRIEKKDKNTNEPVQFYVAKARQPYEIVVNEVGKNIIKGYLSTPKDQVARN